MRTHRFAASIASLILAAVMPGMTRAQTPNYAQQVSSGKVTLTLEPEWQDTALIIVVRAEARSGNLKDIDLRNQVMLIADRQTYRPTGAGLMTGRRALAWVAFHLPKKPDVFALSIRDVPDTPMRILRWPPPVLTP